MDANHTDYKSLSLAYDVAFDLSRELEQQCLAGKLDGSLLPVLSGCYSAIDFFSNRIAALEVDEEDVDEDHELSIDAYREAACIMKTHTDILQRNPFDDRCSGQVDYKKIHALVGIRQVYSFIDHILRID